MNTRPYRCNRLLAALLLIVAAVPLTSGCTSALATAVWLMRGNDGPAEYAGLKGKEVVVVCRPMVSLQYRNQSVSKDIAQQVGVLLSQNVRKLKLVNQRKVEQWMDENTWDEFLEVGKAMKAEVVVGIDLHEFNIHSGQTVFQGKARAAVKVYDCKTGDLLFEKGVPEFTYPPNHVVPASDVQENDFRKKFVAILSERIARKFYPHDRHDDMELGSQNFDF